MHTYEVETTRSIAEEMARYDEATYQQLHFVRLGSLKPITDEQEAIARCRSQKEVNTRLVYRWRFTSVDPPTRERWASFMVKVDTRMKCQVCYKRKATTAVEDKQLGMLRVCKQCESEFYTEPTAGTIEQEAERANESRSMDEWYR